MWEPVLRSLLSLDCVRYFHLWVYTLTRRTSSSRLPAPEAPEEFILSKIDFLMDTSVWPASEALDPRGWLDNFPGTERRFALNLLNVFLYYNEQLVDALFRRAVLQLSRRLTEAAQSTIQANVQWRTFISQVLVTYVEGETPNPSDSGYVFARKARQILGIQEDQIVAPDEALTLHVRNPMRPILLVDDFIGSGNQTRNAWSRLYPMPDGTDYSFRCASAQGAHVVYVPIMSTASGLAMLESSCPGLHIRPAHILDSQYSLTSPDSILWPVELKPHADDFLRSASDRAGIIANSEVTWDGFQSLALALAFYHCVPDATIPLYYWEQSGWIPLIRRT